MLINLDVAATVYFQSGSLLELAVKILNYQHIGKEIIMGKPHHDAAIVIKGVAPSVVFHVQPSELLFVIDDLSRELPDYDRGKLEKSLRGLLIKVTHRGEVRRNFKISKLTPTPASSTFFMKDNTRTTVAAYFLQTHGRRLQYPFMPCVVTGKDVFLPMEICSVIEVIHWSLTKKKKSCSI